MAARFELNSESTFRSTTMLATFLDPRYRSLRFLTPIQRQTVYVIDEAETETCRLFDMTTSDDTSKSNVAELETDDATANREQNDPMVFYDTLGIQRTHSRLKTPGTRRGWRYSSVV